MSKPREKSSVLIHVGDNDEGMWWANVDTTLATPALQPDHPARVQGHGMSLRDAVIDLMDNWKAAIAEKRQRINMTREPNHEPETRND